jgi:hypothetical protein
MAHAQKSGFRLSAKRTSPFKSARASVQSTIGSRGVRISGSNAGYTMFRCGVKSTGYPLHSLVSPSLPLPCVTLCHHISTGLYYSPMRTFVSLIDFSQSALFYDVRFQFLILRLLILVCAQFHHLFFGRHISRLPWRLLLNTWLTFLVALILFTWPIQFNRLTLTNKSVSKFPDSWINSVLYRWLEILIYWNSPKPSPQNFSLKSSQSFGNILILCPGMCSLCCQWSGQFLQTCVFDTLSVVSSSES